MLPIQKLSADKNLQDLTKKPIHVDIGNINLRLFGGCTNYLQNPFLHRVEETEKATNQILFA